MPKTEFSHRSEAKDGLSFWCRDCHTEYQIKQRERLKANKKMVENREKSEVYLWDDSWIYA